jgi:hypothetical protein
MGGILGHLAERRWTVAARAKAYWIDGREAGRTRLRRSTTEPPQQAHGRQCFTLGEMPICHDASDVTPE